MNWPALAVARRRDASARVPFWIDGHEVGSVARAHLGALRTWPNWLKLGDGRVALHAPDRDAALATINTALREAGLVRAWRDEPYAIVDLASGERLARTERAAARFWGTLTFGAHATGYVAGVDGRATHLWIARRSAHKATDPGLLDNLIGAGVPDGQSPVESLVREGWEEAGLSPQQMAAARPGRVLHLHRDLPEGLQREDLHSFDLALPRGVTPHNQDGEVAAFECLPVALALQRAASQEMTVDAALVTLDFALRHALLAPALAAPLHAAVAALALPEPTPRAGAQD